MIVLAGLTYDQTGWGPTLHGGGPALRPFCEGIPRTMGEGPFCRSYIPPPQVFEGVMSRTGKMLPPRRGAETHHLYFCSIGLCFARQSEWGFR